MSARPATLVWFRLDLRLEDNPALAAAVSRGGPVVPIYVFAPDEEGAWPPGAASRWWLRRSLAALDSALRRRGSRLLLRRGPSAGAILDAARRTGARAVFWNRRTEPALAARDAQVAAALRRRGIEAADFGSHLLFDPAEVRTRTGEPFRVFTPFWRACLEKGEPPGTVPVPRRLPAPLAWPDSEPLASFQLDPAFDWASGLEVAWRPGEAGARAALEAFLGGPLDGYAADRDRPDRAGTSRLSPHLHFGEIGPRQVWRAIRERAARAGPIPPDPAAAFLRQLGWREFAHHLLHHFPRTPLRALRPGFDRFPWRRDAAGLRAWRRGRTGFPIVDAGMRELWTTGWMHNRARMIAASFLVKDLLLPWQEGARFFWDTLVDADLANNTLGWQWSAGCGADAAPWFRIFNPALQGARFDPDGVYVCRWVPDAGKTPPIVDHERARRRALAAFAARRRP
jgi:deoxyribodipyrimidine photo-lyase